MKYLTNANIQGDDQYSTEYGQSIMQEQYLVLNI